MNTEIISQDVEGGEEPMIETRMFNLPIYDCEKIADLIMKQSQFGFSLKDKMPWVAYTRGHDGNEGKVSMVLLHFSKG